ncbi:MAG: hypothetical protein U0572_03300 [Phycisphaerales bacterium]
MSDGTNVSYDTVTVTVNADDDAPSVDAGANQVVDEGANVTLGASATDPEGQGLSYTWTQVGGPSVTLAHPHGPTPSFVAPELPANAQLTFQVAVSDGTNVSYDTVTVTVNADNDAPTDVAIDVHDIVPESPTGTVVGSASAYDSDSVVRYELSGGNGAFVIDSASGVITVGDCDALRAHGGGDVTLHIRVLDDGGNVVERDVVVAVAAPANPNLVVDPVIVPSTDGGPTPQMATQRPHVAPSSDVGAVVTVTFHEADPFVHPSTQVVPPPPVESDASAPIADASVEHAGRWASVTDLVSASDEGPHRVAVESPHGGHFDEMYVAASDGIRLEIDRLAAHASQAAQSAPPPDGGAPASSMLAALWALMRGWGAEREEQERNHDRARRAN